MKVSKAEWNMDQWKSENYVYERTVVQGEQKEQELREVRTAPQTWDLDF